ncbi:biotin-dependent carboxyltransferase family protein [Halomonas sp. PR-M31]|uniref:5-oxoprolinase subunit C family protein n=1 Tax=Halomonas sp. PR-M31 TaxID=1471202 RepID=UPI000651AB9B|nr:biotin-dependent carboxyltransferase family protein [Halomonas sp. PR-M31]
MSAAGGRGASGGSRVQLRVEQAGPLALLQDAGRFGVRRLGVTQGGPVDIHAWAWANHLLNNQWGAAALEITFGGLSLIAEGDAQLAISGADLEATLDDDPIEPWSRFEIQAGQRLRFGSPKDGLRAYLAAPGGFLAEPVLGSVAGVIREGLGGHDGQGGKLQKDDTLIFQQCHEEGELPQAPSADNRPDYSQPARLALVPGAQIAEFDGTSLFAAFNRPWQVDDRADRMGVRLTGPELKCAVSSMISEGIGLGAVQVPPDGQPIVLLNDRQTIGGYPRLGALTPLACARLAQCLPGHEVWLQTQALSAAQADYRRFLQGFLPG